MDHLWLLPKSGCALDAAAGVGTNGLFLARRGLNVLALDVSLVGLRLAMERARQNGGNFAAVVYDLSRLWLPENHFDLVLNFRFLIRSTFTQYRRGLKPGGVLVFESFVSSPHADHPSPYHLKPGELLDAFGDFEILFHRVVPGKRKYADRPRWIEQLIARKPKKTA